MNPVEQAKAEAGRNWERLERCQRHNFRVLTDEELPRIGAGRVICTNCGGDTEYQNMIWYSRGLRHAKQKKK